MATPYSNYGNREDNFELELGRVRKNIISKFVELKNCLEVREKHLLEELDEIKKYYQTYIKRLKIVKEEKEALEIMKNRTGEKLPTPAINEFQDNLLQQIREKRELIETPIEPKMVSFTCDTNTIITEINKLGKLVEKVIIRIDYTSKIQPIVSVCERGKGLEQLDTPYSVSVDNTTGNIYVVDCDNNCVKVFDSSGKYLFKFGDEGNEGNLYCPSGIAICGDKILISSGSIFNFGIFHYELDGNFVSKIGKSGKGETEFSFPLGVTIDESNGDIFICDCKNNRIQVLSNNFQFKSQFGIDFLVLPRDVKLSNEYIYVLDTSNPCLHLFSYNFKLQKSVISRGKQMLVVNPYNFFIDNFANILISDCDSNSILIFNPKFKFTHKIQVSNSPMGVTVDNHGRVIVVCRADDNCLQIF